MRKLIAMHYAFTIYDKLKKDLNNNNSPKYVFCGLGCFPVLLQIITDDDYRDKSISLYDSDIYKRERQYAQGERVAG